MGEAALLVSRWAQFGAAAILFGAPLFFLYGLPREHSREFGWVKSLVTGAALVALTAALLGLSAQSAEMSGDDAAAFDPGTVWAVVSTTYYGVVWWIRLALILALLAAARLTPGPGAWRLQAAIGAAIAGSFAWIGHGGEGEGILGLIHRLSDIAHLLAASVWIGALVVLIFLLVRATTNPAAVTVAAFGLSRFSGIGVAVVAVLLLTGIVNALALTFPRGLTEVLATDYARVLLIKVAIFVLMLVLATANRFWLTPRLNAVSDEKTTDAALRALRASVVAETCLAALVLAAVAALGTMEPPSAS